MYIPDNYDAWEAHEREQDAALESLPICDWCKERIQDDFYYDFEYLILHEECLEAYKKRTEDYVE